MNLHQLLKLRNKSILCSTTDAGAALYASPIVKKLRENNQVDIYAGPHGSLVLTQNGIFHKPLNNAKKHAEIARSLVGKKKYDLFLLGTNLGPSLEKELTLLGKSHSILTIAFIDHFWHPWQRFAQLEEQKKNVFLPNDIWVIDRWVKDRLIENCVPSPIIKIVAHPYLKTLKKRREKTNRREILRKLEIPEELKIITIASEPPPTGKIAWASEELSTQEIKKSLHQWISAVNKFSAEHKDIFVIIKKHPTEKAGFLKNDYAGIRPLHKIVRNFRPYDIITISCIVFGFTSMFLLESAKIGVPTASLCLQIKHKIPHRMGKIAFLTSEKDILAFLKEYI